MNKFKRESREETKRLYRMQKEALRPAVTPKCPKCGGVVNRHGCPCQWVWVNPDITKGE